MVQPQMSKALAEPEAEPQGPSGQRIVFWLFVSLAIATALALAILAQAGPADFRPRVYASLVGDLGLPLIAWQLLRAIAQWRERREARRTISQP